MTIHRSSQPMATHDHPPVHLRLVRALQVGVFLEELTVVRGNRQLEQLAEGPTADLIATMVDDAAARRDRLGGWIETVDPSISADQLVRPSMLEPYAALEGPSFEDPLDDQLYAGETAYKFYADLVDTLPALDVGRGDRDALTAALLSLREETAAGVEAVTRRMGER
mgnify:CR=1 FL=1